MSYNPFYLELLAKERQAELLSLVQPQRIPVPLHNRLPLGRRVRLGIARLLIRIGRHLSPCTVGPVCRDDGGRAVCAPPSPRCSCPGRGRLAGCPPLGCD